MIGHPKNGYLQIQRNNRSLNGQTLSWALYFFTGMCCLPSSLPPPPLPPSPPSRGSQPATRSSQIWTWGRGCPGSQSSGTRWSSSRWKFWRKTGVYIGLPETHVYTTNISKHKWWPNSCSFYSEEGANVWPSNVLWIVFPQTLLELKIPWAHEILWIIHSSQNWSDQRDWCNVAR